MARRRKMTPERREFINSLLEHYQPTDAQDVQERTGTHHRKRLPWYASQGAELVAGPRGAGEEAGT